MKNMKMILNLLATTGLMYILTGCVTTSSTIKNAKREIAIRNLLHQEEVERIDNLMIKEVKQSDIMEKELKSFKADPIHPKNRTYIGEYTRHAIMFNPSLNLKKYSTTMLSSKTGQRTTYTTSFGILNINLSSFMSKRYYLKLKYLDKIINDEAKRLGYGGNYIVKIRKSMLGYGAWGSFVAVSRTNEYFISLENVTYRAIALYNLSDKSAKISAIVYYLEQHSFDKVDKIIIKEWEKHAIKEANRINKIRYSQMKNILVTYRSMRIDDLKKNSKKYMGLYYVTLPVDIAIKRKLDADEELREFFEFAKKANVDNVFEFMQKYKHNKRLINLLSVAIVNSGHRHPLIYDYSTNPTNCLEAGLFTLINEAKADESKNKYYIDNAAFNINYMEKLKCPETNIFRKKLEKIVDKANNFISAKSRAWHDYLKSKRGK